MLESHENEGGAGALITWESSSHFVVLGHGNAILTEAAVDVCKELELPILRRISGGGAVVQGPGCLSYALVLPISEKEMTASITSTNRFVMGQQRRLMATLTSRSVLVDGITDLSVDGRKFSGNSQRRRKRFFLFHGTMLCRFDLELAARVLRHPTREPEYRAHRPHSSFLTNINLTPATIVSCLVEGWRANREGTLPPMAEIQSLANEKYASAEWTWKF